MPTVGELSAPYENHLVPVLPVGDGICATCHTNIDGTWDKCYQCHETLRALSETADAVSFVALAVKGEQLARDLWVYKNSPIQGVRTRTRDGLAAVLWRWLAEHESCAAAAAGVASFPIVTTVPSTSGRPNHPFIEMVNTTVGATKGRYVGLLRANPAVDSGREPRDDRFVAVQPIKAGEAVLVLDDTWTSGGHAQSAVSALKALGAGRVAVAAIGRHFNRQPQNPEYRAAAESYYKAARSRRWDWSRCCLCDDP